MNLKLENYKRIEAARRQELQMKTNLRMLMDSIHTGNSGALGTNLGDWRDMQSSQADPMMSMNSNTTLHNSNSFKTEYTPDDIYRADIAFSQQQPPLIPPPNYNQHIYHSMPNLPKFSCQNPVLTDTHLDQFNLQQFPSSCPAPQSIAPMSLNMDHPTAANLVYQF